MTGIDGECSVGEGWGIAGLKWRAITFRVFTQCRGNDGVFDIRILTPIEIFYCEGRGKEQSFDLQLAIAGH